MIVRRINGCGDIATSGEQFARNIEAVETLVHTRLKLFLGEYFRDITEGTPWWQDIFGKQPDRARAEQLVRARIAQTDSVTRLIEFNVHYEDRTMMVQCTFDTIYGEGSVDYGTDYN